MKDVVPSIKTNSDGLKQVLDELLKQYKTKQGEMDSWKVRIFLYLRSRTLDQDQAKGNGKLGSPKRRPVFQLLGLRVHMKLTWPCRLTEKE